MRRTLLGIFAGLIIGVTFTAGAGLVKGQTGSGDTGWVPDMEQVYNTALTSAFDAAGEIHAPGDEQRDRPGLDREFPLGLRGKQARVAKRNNEDREQRHRHDHAERAADIGDGQHEVQQHQHQQQPFEFGERSGETLQLGLFDGLVQEPSCRNEPRPESRFNYCRVRQYLKK